MRNLRSQLPTRPTMLEVAVTAWALSISVSAAAKVSPIELKELVERSDIIVVATVTGIEATGQVIASDDRRFPPLRLATADVMETWKGPRLRAVRFIASPTQQCDITSAANGEKLALFLIRHGNSPIMTITHVGRGRMSLATVKDEQYARISNDILLPAGARVVTREEPTVLSLPAALFKPGEKGSKSFTLNLVVRSVELKALRDLVKGYVAVELLERLAWAPRL
jgi:hypothetical protein